VPLSLCKAIIDMLLAGAGLSLNEHNTLKTFFLTPRNAQQHHDLSK